MSGKLADFSWKEELEKQVRWQTSRQVPTLESEMTDSNAPQYTAMALSSLLCMPATAQLFEYTQSFIYSAAPIPDASHFLKLKARICLVSHWVEICLNLSTYTFLFYLEMALILPRQGGLLPLTMPPIYFLLMLKVIDFDFDPSVFLESHHASFASSGWFEYFSPFFKRMCPLLWFSLSSCAS